MIETEGLTREYHGVPVVNGLTLSVPKGALFGLLGRNGAGKTTTLKMLSTILAPSAGTARLGGFDIIEDPLGVRSIIGVIHESSEPTKPLWTPIEYLTFFLRLRGSSQREAEHHAKLWLETLDLRNQARRPIGEFSAGMRRRLELCRALSRDPDILILDEPTKELDIPGKREVWELVRNFAAKERKTIILSSHEAAEIQAICEQFAILKKGTCSFSGPTEGLPRSVFRIASDSHDATIQELRQVTQVRSFSSVGRILYVAFSDDMTVPELQNTLSKSSSASSDIQQAESIDERMLAFL